MKCRKIVFLPLFLIILLCQYPPAFCSGYSEYKGGADYSSFNPDEVRNEANAYFENAYECTTEDCRTLNYSNAMKKYYILSQIYPADFYAYVQMARIHDNLKNDTLAKKNYFISFNLDKFNPYTNFYFGEYHFKREMYYKALKYYLIAYNNGYKDNYVTTLKLAELYEKLGDLKKSKEFYQKAYNLDPQESGELKIKIDSLKLQDYEKTEYYHSIRE